MDALELETMRNARAAAVSAAHKAASLQVAMMSANTTTHNNISGVVNDPLNNLMSASGNTVATAVIAAPNHQTVSSGITMSGMSHPSLASLVQPLSSNGGNGMGPPLSLASSLPNFLSAPSSALQHQQQYQQPISISHHQPISFPHKPTSQQQQPMLSHQQQHPMPNQANSNHNTQHNLPPDAVICVACNYPGSDIRIKAPCACAYHARCIDLVSLSNNAHAHNNNSSGKKASDNDDDGILITACPNCHGPAHGLEIIPLSFLELDRAQRLGRRRKGLLNGALNNGSEVVVGGELSKKRSSSGDLVGAAGRAGGGGVINTPSSTSFQSNSTNPSQYNAQASQSSASSSTCYDPTTPRTGRWTDEELAFRDAIISHFINGSLPLSNGLKLNDFLSNMLKSKQSRLTKKMKHAKLSTKYFRIQSGHLSNNPNGISNNTQGAAVAAAAKQFSKSEQAFIQATPDPIERTEISFHMQREWRDHLALRLQYLRLSFTANTWLASIDLMERRLALVKNNERSKKRRCLMGRAMEKDLRDGQEGVFIDQSGLGGSSADGIGGNDGNGGEDYLEMKDISMSPNVIGMGGKESATDDGEFGRFLMSMLDEAPITTNINPGQQYQSHPHKKTAPYRSATDPNFRYAAPFLAGITSYMERHAVPFEHVDIWVPSSAPPMGEEEGLESSRPVLGSGSHSNLAGLGGVGVGGGAGSKDGSGGVRLCFAGSATLGVQIVDEPSTPGSPTKHTNDEKKSPPTNKKIAPLTSDEIFNFSLYGDYSEKFSFSPACGLPGRVYSSNSAAWEQYLPNAPAIMFERRGGAVQFGIKTALGLPIDSPNVGRIVVVLYSKHNREKDEGLVGRMVRDVRMFCPSPRWKLVVDVRSGSSGDAFGTGPAAGAVAGPPAPLSMGMAGSSSFSANMSALSMQPASQSTSLGMDLAGDASQQLQHNSSQATNKAAQNKHSQTVNLINLLQETMPSDSSSPLGKQLHSILSLREILLRSNRTSEEEQLVDTILVLYESYIAAERTKGDIALLVSRDYDFHMQHAMQHVVGNNNNNMAPPSSVPMGQGPMTMQGVQQQQQQHPAQQTMLHNFNAASTMASTGVGSFIPPPAPGGGILLGISPPYAMAPPVAPGVPSGVSPPFYVGAPAPPQVLQNVFHHGSHGSGQHH
mmetsp:Transcript_16324/g.35278  ORF Transcript_16324/g.35278 Transcript_16324/m.35278 type:complete len:1158 (+) Transcript_16324:148-3621(+)